MSWSPKGKQLLIGKMDGALVRVDKTGAVKATLPAPPNSTNLAGMYTHYTNIGTCSAMQ